jgi:hypothetical protein
MDSPYCRISSKYKNVRKAIAERVGASWGVNANVGVLYGGIQHCKNNMQILRSVFKQR